MLGYSIYDKSINGIKTISDGKLLISNGNINNCSNVYADSIDTNNHNCNELSLIKNGITIDTDEFLTLNNIDKTKTIQEQFNNISTVNTNLQNQINVNTNKNVEQDTKILNIETLNTTQNNSITSINSSITSINSTNTTQNTRLSTIENSAIYNLSSGTITTNTLSEGSNSSVSLTITQPTSNPNNKNLNFTFNIPRGNTGTTGETGISFIWKDTWTNPYIYYKNDVVYWDGSSYICLGHKDNRNNPVIRDVNPSDNPDEWVKMCAKGEQGPQGSTGSSGLDDFLSALGLAGLIGGSALAILAGVLSISDNATSLQNGINGLNNSLNATNARVSTLEQKTQNQTATSGNTSFQGNVFMKNPWSQSTIDLNGYNGKITAISSSINDGNFTNINSTNLSSGNLNASGQDISIGTSSISTININSLSTYINGFIYINGVLYQPYIPTNVFQQFT